MRPVLAGAPAALLLLGLGILALAVRLAPLPGFWSGARSRDEGTSLITVLDRTGRCLAVTGGEGPAFLPVGLDRIDPLLIGATLAAEDRRFYAHPGIDPMALARALLQDLRAGRCLSGGSTLTQQVVKILIEEERRGRWPDPGPGRSRPSLAQKLRQAFWALVLEARLSKGQILEAYLDHASYGATIRGVGAACRLYYGHLPDHMTLEEAALLAALPQSPVRLDPRQHPEAARRARDRVLARMALPAEEREAAAAGSLDLSPPPPSVAVSDAPHWITHVLQSSQGCAEIRLPLDPGLQKTAREALQQALARLGERGADDGAVIILHNPSGEVRAYVGSPDWRDPRHGQFDAVRALRQPGSALKPFTYALAFEHGLRPNSLLPDLPLNYGGCDGSYRPRNYSGAYHGPVRARMALANSWNAPAVSVLARLGPEKLLALLRSLGLTSLTRSAQEYGLGLTLGDGEVSLAELTTAYSCLARGGRWRPRVEVLEAWDERGRPRRLTRAVGGEAAASRSLPDGHQVISSTSAFWVNSILSDERSRALAFGEGGPFAFSFPVAVKTGTSSDWRDNWAFGYTREWTIGVWVGAAQGTPMDRVSGTQGAILALREILLQLYPEDATSSGASGFAPPPGMAMGTICALSGRPAGPDCPEAVSEWFGPGDEPGPTCAWHRRVAIDLGTGLLARPCTPPERVRQVLYTLPDFSDVWSGAATSFALFSTWVRDQGWPLPPEELTDCLCGEPACASPRPAVPRPASRCRITHPVDGAIYALDASLPGDQQEVALEGAGGSEEILWRVDGSEIGRSRPGERLFWKLAAGRHRIRAERRTAGADEVMIEVEGPRGASAPAQSTP